MSDHTRDLELYWSDLASGFQQRCADALGIPVSEVPKQTNWEFIPLVQLPVKPLFRAPSEVAIRHWIEDGQALATDGCVVELHEHCDHGYPSWILVLNL